MCRELLCRDSGITVSLINDCSNTYASRCEVSIEILTDADNICHCLSSITINVVH